MAGIFGWQGQLGVDPTATIGAGNRLDFLRENLVLDEAFVDTNGLRGTRSRAVERVRQGNRHVHGQIVLQPTAVELAVLLPWILGTAVNTNVYALADTTLTRYVVIDRGSKVFTYDTVAVDRATFHGSQGEPMELTLDLVGKDETIGNSGTFPALTLDITTGPFMFTDAFGALTVNSAVTNSKSIEITIDNNIDKERFFLSQTLVTAQAMDRHVTVNMSVPYGDASALYGLGATGTAVSATFTNGGTSLIFSFVKVCFPRKSPSFTAGRAEELMPLQGIAYKSGTTLELVTTLDSVP